MAERKIVTNKPITPLTKDTIAKKPVSTRAPLFEKQNYMWMIIGAVVVALGMVLLGGGRSANVNEFDYKSVYSFTRMTIAPILILAGLVLEIYAIFKRPKVQQ